MGVVYASPDGRGTQFQGQSVRSYKLDEAIQNAEPGDVVQLLPGTYTDSVCITVGGRPGEPLIIRGADGVELDGRTVPSDAYEKSVPEDSDFAFFKVLECEQVVFEGLSFCECWPSAIYVRGSRDISLIDSDITGSRYVLYARNKLEDKPFSGFETRGFLLDHVRWVQDPDRLMWSGVVTWQDVKDKDYHPQDYFNGALFGSKNIFGWVTVRNCRVSHAFNGIRMQANENGSYKRDRNLNVHIHNNRFEYIRDNAIEPEQGAVGWWAHDNEIRNAHASFSLTDLSGGYWYFFNNRVWFDSQPSIRELDDNRGGKILKVTKKAHKRMPDLPWYFFHNSIFLRSSYAKNSETRHLKHSNNAIQFCFNTRYCLPERTFFGPFGDHFRWHESYEFENDLSNHPDFPDRFDAKFGYKLSGIRAKRIFQEPKGGNLRLLPGSRARGAAIPVKLILPDGSLYWVNGRDIGAYQHGAVINWPQFVEYEPQ